LKFEKKTKCGMLKLVVDRFGKSDLKKNGNSN
jgi:hypothetical protein